MLPEHEYEKLLYNISDAYAYHQVVMDGENNPVDYIFLEVNPAFEKMTGLKRERILGKKITEVLPGMENAQFDWIGTYGEVAVTGKTICFEQYSEPLGRYYQVTAFGGEDHCFSTIFRDVTDQKANQERTKELNCLHNFSLLLRKERDSISGILEGTVELLPSSFQYPENICARITWEESEFKTGDFWSNSCKISSSLEVFGESVGALEVCFIEPPLQENSPFLKEEELMIYTIAEHLSRVIEQLQAKEALQESEEKLSTTLHSIGDGVIVTDTRGRITRLNYSAEKLTGWSSKEVVGQALDKVFRIFNTRTKEPSINPVYQVINTGKIEGMANDTTLVSRDGTRRQIADSAAPICDHAGNTTGVIMVFSDVTEEYRAKQALKKSEERLETILSNVPAVIYSYKMIDGKPVITYVNKNAKNVLGYTPQEIMNRPLLWFNCIHPQDLDDAQSVLSELPVKGYVSLEYRFKLKTGGYRWLQEQQKQIFNEEGEPEIFAVCWDITEGKQAEKLIEARLNLLTYSYHHSLEEVLQKTIDELCEIIESPIGFYHFVSSDEEMLTLKAWSTETLKHFCDVGDMRGMRYPVSEAGVWADSIRRRRPVIHNDYHSLPNRKGMPQGHAEVVRELVVPVMRQDKIVAILGIGNKPEDYTERDVQLASYFADVAWTIVEQKQAEEQIRYMSFHDGLTGLYNRYYLEEEMKRLDRKRQLPISIIMVDLNGLKLVNDTYGHYLGDEMLKYAAEIINNSCRQEDITARWGGDEFVILLSQTDQKETEKIQKRIKEGCREAYVREVPVSLAIGSSTKEEAEKQIEEVVKEAEDSMYQQKLAEEKSNRNLLLNTLLKTIQAKSYETEEHTIRMLYWAWKIGEKIGLIDSELNLLKLVITLHDIGKINIPEEILTKEGALTDEEWESIKKHPEVGYRIARASEDFAHVAEDILSHHERWDGTGYPRGLMEKEIPLLSRITAIVDAYEVMSNGRPYKDPMSKEEIIAEFKRCAGNQFDPELVEIFLSVLEELR